MRVDELILEVRDKTLARKGQIPPELLVLDAQLVDLGVGTWKVTLPTSVPGRPEVADMVALLRTPGSGLIVTHVDPAVGVLWSGPMQVPGVSADASDPQGTITVEGVTDDVILWRRRAYPTPASADVTAQTNGWDVRTGTAESVMRAYVDANLGPPAPASRRITALSLAANLHRGPDFIKSVRFDVLGDLLVEIAVLAGLGFRVVQVGSGLVFQVLSRTDRSGLVRLDLLNGTLASTATKVVPPELTRAIVAGQGEGAARTLIERSTTESLAAETAWGPWGRSEEFIDQRQTDVLAELQQAGDKRLTEAGATSTSVTAIPADDQTMRYPQDWGLGDTVAVVVEGQETKPRVASVQIVAGPGGVRVGAGIGEVAGWKPPATVAALDSVSSRVGALERNAEVSVGGVTPFAQAAGALYGGAVSTEVYYPSGRFTVTPVLTLFNVVYNVPSTAIPQVTTNGTQGFTYINSGAAINLTLQWHAVQMTPTAAAG